MLNTIKIPVMFLILTLLVLLPKASYAWGDDQHGRGDGGARHEHGFRAHSNPDITLVTGMDNIDRRVLIAADPDPQAEVIDDQPAAETVVAAPVPMVAADMDTFVVNVPNSRGGYTPVLIRKWGNGYLGPQGELYFPFPQISQLKAMYAL